MMVEEADDNTLHIAVSYPNLNFNITKTLDSASQITAQERFYSVSTPVDIEVIGKLIFLLFYLFFENTVGPCSLIGCWLFDYLQMTQLFLLKIVPFSPPVGMEF